MTEDIEHKVTPVTPPYRQRPYLCTKSLTFRMELINDWKFVLFACLLLGLAPFVPEPHIFGKVRWILGGAVGMKPIDWFDFLWHTWPFVLLIRLAVLHLWPPKKRELEEEKS